METKNEKNSMLEELLKEMQEAGIIRAFACGKEGHCEKAQRVASEDAADKSQKGNQKTGQLAQENLEKHSVPAVTLNIKNLHIHMDERMTSYNYGFGQGDGCDAVSNEGEHGSELPDDDDDIDFEEMAEAIRKETGLCETVILTVLLAQMHYLDTVFGDEEGKA